MKKVLGILTSVDIYGKERANIEVYNLLKYNEKNIDFYVAINNQANDKLKEAVSYLSPISFTVPKRHSKRFRFLTFLYTYIIGNIQLLSLLIKLRPVLLMMNNEIDFYDFFPALYFYRKRIIYRVGDAPAFKTLSVKKYNTYVWNHYVIPRVTVFVCNSRYVMSTIKDVGRINKKDKIIYNYPPTRLSHHDAKEKEKYVLKESDDVSFGYIGQIFEQKGVHHFISCALKILKLHPTSLFYIAGSLIRMPEYSAKLVKMIPPEYKSNIIFLGEIENIDIFFNNIDVLCIPSIKQEPLANVLVEAKQHSKPCVIYPSGGMPELVQHKVDGYICKSQEPEALLEGMNYYVENPKLVKENGKEAYQSIKIMGIDKDNFTKKWLEVFNETIQ